MQYTENYNLYKPVYGEPADVADLNHNADEIDELIHDNRTMIAPAFDTAKAYVTGDPVEYQGKLYVFTDDKAAGAWDSSKVEQTTAAEIGGGGASALADLTDVDVITPADGEVLMYDSASSKWKNATLPTPTVPDELNDMSDVDITTPTDGQILVYDDTDDEWKNADIPEPSVTAEATGNPIELTDAADAPMVKCVSAITGSQDLHGYDKPWVGGAGKNKYNYETRVDDYYIRNDGEIRAATGSCYSALIPVSGTITLSGHTVNGGVKRIIEYDSNGDFLRLGNYVETTANSDYSVSVTVGTGTVSVRISLLMADTNVQLEEGSTATTYEPYSNICPITAYTEGEIEVRGKNLLLVETVTAGGKLFNVDSEGYVTAAGQTSDSRTWNYSNSEFFATLKAGLYTILIDTKISTSNQFRGLKIFTPDNSEIFNPAPSETFSAVGVVSKSFRVTQDTSIGIMAKQYDAVFRVAIYKSTETSNSYEPYTSTTHTTTFPSAIYRGSVDVVNGTVTTEWGMIASYAGETLPGEWISDRDEYAPGTTPTTGAQVAYELATPTTSSVTPTNLPIRTLSGYNYIESSTGDMEVEYITKPYEPLIDATDISIEEHGKTIESIITENLEPRMVASRNYTVGKLIISGDKAYRATANIASGAALTVGTNVASTTIEEEIGRSGHVYSTSEKVVGTWIDGSTLYEKVVVNSSALVVGDNSIGIPTDATSIISATGVFASGTYSNPLNFFAANSNSVLALDELNATSHTLRVRIGSDYSSLLTGAYVYIIIRYIK